MYFSIAYSLFQIAQGLLIHPYQTMQSLVKDKVFAWMVLTPTVTLAVVTLAWRFVVVPGVRIVFSCSSSLFWGCDWLSFVSNCLTFFCLYWQIMLLYLLFRFRSAFGT